MIDTQSIRDDLAYMRSVAEHGSRAPLLGGSILTVAGAVFGAAAVAHWGVTSGAVDLPRSSLVAIWGVASVIFYGALWTFKRRVGARSDASAPGSRAFGAVWAGLGGALFVVFFAFAAASIRNGTELPMTLFAVVVIAMYGTGWFVAHAISGRAWLFWVGLASMSVAFTLGLTAGESYQFLVYAGALFGLAMVPGLILMRTEPAEAV